MVSNKRSYAKLDFKLWPSKGFIYISFLHIENNNEINLKYKLMNYAIKLFMY